MHQNLIDDDFSERGVKVDNPLRNTDYDEEKSYKCNQCDYASALAWNLRTHLKNHSGIKTNKCNQCDFASMWAGSLRTHILKKLMLHKTKCSAPRFLKVRQHTN